MRESAESGKAIGTGLPKPQRAHAMTLCALDSKHGTAGLSVFPVGFCTQGGYAEEVKGCESPAQAHFVKGFNCRFTAQIICTWLE